ncbi:small ribosomal subunit protein bS18m-like isoform X4 [Acipenser ruthenus]|uniref:small ribosomal subunit protein bS18m-like isoform X4 n=1 Tax=Acipenser ruthenus TaxID=7906 RepID=UPI00145B1DD7|nr:small ribosomal subunit protein bS18m-like isoform X4 [Acipenser ruthenus]
MFAVRNCRFFITFTNLKVTTRNPGLWQRSLSIQQYENPAGNNDMLLSQFVSPHTGRIYGRHITGLCGKKQKEVSKAIKRAHHMGFMPVTLKEPAFLKDPNVCDIKYPE